MGMPNGNTFSALLAFGAATASPLCLSDLAWYFPLIKYSLDTQTVNLENRVYLKGPFSNTEWKKVEEYSQK